MSQHVGGGYPPPQTNPRREIAAHFSHEPRQTPQEF